MTIYQQDGSETPDFFLLPPAPPPPPPKKKKKFRGEFYNAISITLVLINLG